jgi:hypothetical protein
MRRNRAGTIGKQGRALRFPELDGTTLLGIGRGAASGCAQGHGERDARVGVIEQRVGGGAGICCKQAPKSRPAYSTSPAAVGSSRCFNLSYTACRVTGISS